MTDAHARVNARSIDTKDDLVAGLDALRRQAAEGLRKSRLSIDDLVKATSIPRSTVHVYISGRSLPPPDALDALVAAMGATPQDRRAWQDALERVSARGDSPTPRTQVPRQLPPAPRRFVGREADMRAIAEALASEAHGVAVAGPAGSGKTALVGQYARTHADDYPGGVLYADMRGFSDHPPLEPQRALTRFLIALGVAPESTPTDLEALLPHFRDKATRRMLIVLDNVADAPQVSPLLSVMTGHDVIVASRNEMTALTLRTGMGRVRVRPLPNEDAALLLRGIDASVHDLDAVLRLCGGLPLALEVVRDRAMASGSMLGVLEEIRSGEAPLDTLQAGARGGVRRIMDWSYRGLSAEHRAAFRRLGALPGQTLRLESASVALGTPARQTRRALEFLVERSLLTRADAGAWTRHDLVAAFARERLAAEEPASEVAAIRGRLLGFFSDAASRAVRDHQRLVLSTAPAASAGRAERAEAWQTLSQDADTVESVVVEALSDRPRDAWRLAEAAAAAADEHNEYATFADVLPDCLGSARASGDHLAIAAIGLQLGVALIAANDYLPALRVLRGAAGAPDIPASLRVRLLWAQGSAASFAGNDAEAERLLREGLDLETERELPSAERVMALGTLGVLCLRRDDLEAARACSRRIHALPDDDDELYGYTLILDARIHMAAGELDAADDALRRARRVAARSTRTLRSSVLRFAGRLAELRGDLDAAEASYREGIDVASRNALRRPEAELTQALGDLLDASGRPDEALAAYRRSLWLLRELGVAHAPGLDTMKARVARSS